MIEGVQCASVSSGKLCEEHSFPVSAGLADICSLQDVITVTKYWYCSALSSV